MSFSAVKSIVGKVLKNCNVTAADVEAYKVFGIWEKLVGPRLAEHSKPIKVIERKLYVEVDDPLWLAQVKFLKTEMLSKIDSTVKKGTIKDIRFYLKGFS